MLRIIAIAAMLALALPSLAAAEQQQNQRGKPFGAKPGGGGPPGGNRAFVRPGGQVVNPNVGRTVVTPHVGGPVGTARVVGGAQFSYRGHTINRVHGAAFVYPSGWAYRRWAAGAILPSLFLVPAYYYADWAALGLAAPEPGFQWVRYGPDLVLVNVSTGEIVDVVYGAFY
jgi:Ni/Co efflux regulator RcnB